MLTREQLNTIQAQLEAAYAIIMFDETKQAEAAELMLSIRTITAARQAL